jgi:TRAP-type C4-dicarboxylate transport system permease small subunit
MTGLFSRAAERLSALLAQVSMWAVGIMMVIVVADVALRTFASSSLLIADEMGGYLLVLLCCFAYAEALKADRHVRVDLVYNLLSARTQRRLDVFFTVLGIAAIAVVLYTSILMAYRSYARGVTVPGILLTPIWVPQLAQVIGLASLLLQLIAELPKLSRKA